MSIFYSNTSKGFYDDGFHARIPSDAIEVSASERGALIAGVRLGKAISVADGAVFLVDGPQLSDAEKIALYRLAVGRHIEQKAQFFEFDSIITAVTYADEPADPVNQAYGIAFRAWRSQCWLHCRTALEAWQGGDLEPAVSDLIDGLPVFTPPE